MDELKKNSRGCYIIEVDKEESSTCIKDCCNRLSVYDWLNDLPANISTSDIVEVRFKNTRKAYYLNNVGLKLKINDVVAVEASPGHDIGIVSLTGDLVLLQLKKNNIPFDAELKKIYRKARPVDIDKWEESITLERPAMLKARDIARNLGLDMKIGDVEYQGDKTKAIFYYIAEDRVDFRELIKILAEQLKVRIEMRQIGARQEAGRIGGIGPCGRELCCTMWLGNFNSVTTSSARHQELSLNPQKLAGQCSKLKCCLNYELNTYLDAQKNFPKTDIPLETFDGTAYHQKTDVLKGVMWYSFDPNAAINLTAIPVDRVKEIISLNKKGTKVKQLIEISTDIIKKEPDFENIIGQESLTRFDDKRKKKKRKNKPFTINKLNKPKQNENPTS